MLDNSASGRCDLRCFYNRMDDRMALDILPCLRAIAIAEMKNEEFERESGEKRRSRRRRKHHFDEFGINIPDEYVGWEVGERFAKLRLGGVKEEKQEKTTT